MPLATARAEGTFTASHQAWWHAARPRTPDAAGARELIEVLLAHRHVPHAELVAGLQAACAAGTLTADAVKIATRRIADASTVGSIRTPTPR